MVEEPRSPEEPEVRGAGEAGRLARRAGIYAAALFGAALLLAVAGGAVVALLLGRRLEMSFGRAWAAATALLIGIPLVAQGVTLLVERWRARRR